MAVLAAAALTASCSSSGSTPERAGPRSPSPGRTSASPDTLDRDATATLAGTATVRIGGSQPVDLRTRSSQPVELQLSSSGSATVTLVMRGSGGDLFSLEGPARAGTESADAHVAVLLASAGVLVDTADGNRCSTSYETVSETELSGTVRCETLTGAATVPVVVAFRAA